MYQHRFDRMLRRLARTMGAAGLVAVAAVMIAACGAAGSGEASSPLGVIDQATRTVQLNLIITGSGVNGYPNGEMTVRVPRGWRVDVYCGNQTAEPRSCAIVPGAGSASLILSGATSAKPVVVVPAGGSANFSFIVGTVGSYRVTSLVSGHEDRVWGHFDVVATGKPSVSTSRAPATEVPAPGMQARRNR